MRFPYVVLLSACALTLALPLQAQSPNGVLNGLVVDPSNRAIVGAEVVAVNDVTSMQYPTSTNGEGIYVLPNLPPGPYRLQVSKIGFKTLIKPDITLNTQDALSINFTLPVGAFSETLTVEGGAPLVNTESAAVSTVVDRQFAENLPMNGRSFQTLIQLTPGIVLTPSNGADGGQFSVNGQRTASSYWMVDGVSANFGIGNAGNAQGQGIGGALPAFNVQGGTNSLVSVDALQEFRIQTSSYAPEFGRSPGGQISIVTRSGTNQFHGSAFDYLRNDLFDANDWFADFTNQPKPEERQNDFGGTLSGPIVRERTFFFFSYEGLRLRLPQVALTSVPDSSGPGQTNARENALPAVQPLLNAFPLPNGPEILDSDANPTGAAFFNASFSNGSRLDATSLRLDHQLNGKITLFGRYNYSPSELLARAAMLSDVTRTAITTQTSTLGATWSLSPTMTNDFRFNYSRSGSTISNTLDTFGGAVPLSSAALNLPSPFTPRDSAFEAVIISTGSVVEGRTGSALQQQYNLVDNFSLQKGPHSLKFGADYRHLSPIFKPRLYEPLFEFLDVPSAVAGQLFISLVFAARNASFGLQNLGSFAQDTWRVNSHITLTGGLRWDLDFAPSGNPPFPAFLNFNLGNLSQLALAQPGTPAYRTTYGNVAPRIGVAYQASQKQGRETVLRGGFGVFYDLATQELGNSLTSTQYPYGTRTPLIFGGTYPLDPVPAPPPISPASLSISGVRAFDPQLRLPYTLQWNTTLEQALGGQQRISASYVGSVGRRLLQQGSVSSPNPTFATAEFLTNAATSDYHALQVQFQRRLWQRLQALVSYTWAHSIDTASAGSLVGNQANDLIPGFGPNTNRGPSDFDIRNAFSAGITYDVPVPVENGFAKSFLGGWSFQSIIQARSAPPVDVNYSSFSFVPALFDAFADIRPDRVPGEPLYLHGSQCLQAPPQGIGVPCPGGKGFNPNAFASPPLDTDGNPLRQGTLARNALRGFGAVQWDLAVHRDFSLYNSLKLQFRAEMFNVLNHPNFAPPIGDLSNPASLNPQFGQSIQTLSQSLAGTPGFGGLSSLYQIGGPRSIQLALKLQF